MYEGHYIRLSRLVSVRVEKQATVENRLLSGGGEHSLVSHCVTQMSRMPNNEHPRSYLASYIFDKVFSKGLACTDSVQPKAVTISKK